MKNKSTFVLILVAFLISSVLNAQCWKTVDGGFRFTIGIKNDGTIWSWGSDSNGALGIGTTTTTTLPIKISTANNWSEIFCNYTRAFAIKTDGTLWGWGNNAFGQLGNGTTTNTNVPTQIGVANNWKSISVGGLHTIGLKTDGTIWAWGDNSVGQLGISIATSNTFIPTQVDTCTHWKQIAAGVEHSIGLKTDGTLWAWGRNTVGQLGDGGVIGTYTDTPVQIGTATNWQSVFQCQENSIAIKNDGTLWVWGGNVLGELGLGAITMTNVPTQVGTSNNWKSFITENAFSLGQKTDGSIWACGNNGSGQYGNATSTNTDTPIQTVNPNNWASINIGGGSNSISLKTDGSLWIWGSNLFGQFGNGTTTDSNIPLSISCPSATNIMDENQNLTSVFTIYPNPCINRLHVTSNDKSNIDLIEITEITGKILMTIKDNEGEVDVEKLAAGIYFVKIIRANQHQIVKLIKTSE